MIELAGWGGYPKHRTELLTPRSPRQALGMWSASTDMIARGNGRAYGDAALGRRTTLSTVLLDRMRRFDRKTGLLVAEAGVLLSDIIQTFLPLGFFPPVAPGTKHVTVGGMIAADVHGKNHHRDGGFGSHVQHLRLALPSGEIVECSPTCESELFRATIGGFGLSGMVLEAAFPLRRVATGWMRQQTLVAPDLGSAMTALRDADRRATYTVAWVDCLATGADLGRSLLYVAEHASVEEIEARGLPRYKVATQPRPRATVPFDMPGSILARPTIRLFNELYFRWRGAGTPSTTLIDWDRHFFPLDGLGAWNRLYGKRGFLQYQCVVPDAQAPDVLGELVSRIVASGKASLAVMKRLGCGAGSISFPLQGYTLAVDLRLTPGVQPLLDDLDKIVVAGDGRLYLAKDARQSRETLAAGYPALDEFLTIRRSVDPGRRLASRLSERLRL